MLGPSCTADYVGRLAPSPTGAQHLGNARTFLMTWLLCRRAQGQLFLRIEDLETPRIKSWATDQAMEDLHWLGLDWDPTPNPSANTIGTIVQSHRLARYADVLQELIESDVVYPCTCTRSQIEALAAPHESILDGPVYPGTCSKRSALDAKELDRSGTPYAWRFRMPPSEIQFADVFNGDQVLRSPALELGDFVVARMNGAIAYQLAVVVDDHDTGVTDVVRGDDLVLSTYRQLAIYSYMNWSQPRFCHLPLVVGTDGRRLAKRHGDTRLATLREAGIDPRTVIGYLAFQSGLLDRYEPVTAHELLAIDPLARLPRTPLVFDSANAVEEFKKRQVTNKNERRN